MTDNSAWSGASGSQVLQQGHQAHAILASAKVTEIQGTIEGVSAALSSVWESAEQHPELVDLIEPLKEVLKQLTERVGNETLSLLRNCIAVQPLKEVLKQLTERVGNETLSSLRNCIAALVRLLQKFEADKKLQAAEIIALKREAQDVRAELVAVKQLMQRLQEDRRKVMLGQMAYTVDKAGSEFVFGPGCEFMTLNHLVDSYNAGDLSTEEAERFEEFCKVFKDKCDIDSLVRLLAPLREIRREPAHGYAEEVTFVTLEQLRAWAREFKLPPFVLQRVLPVLELFTEPERPLVLRQNASQVVQ